MLGGGQRSLSLCPLPGAAPVPSRLCPTLRPLGWVWGCVCTPVAPCAPFLVPHGWHGGVQDPKHHLGGTRCATLGGRGVWGRQAPHLSPVSRQGTKPCSAPSRACKAVQSPEPSLSPKGTDPALRLCRGVANSSWSARPSSSSSSLALLSSPHLSFGTEGSDLSLQGLGVLPRLWPVGPKPAGPPVLRLGKTCTRSQEKLPAPRRRLPRTPRAWQGDMVCQQRDGLCDEGTGVATDEGTAEGAQGAGGCWHPPRCGEGRVPFAPPTLPLVRL